MGGPAGSVDHGGSQEVFELPPGSDGHNRDAIGEPDDHHRGSVGLEARNRSLGIEQPSDLVADRRENVIRAHAAGDQGGDPPQRGSRPQPATARTRPFHAAATIPPDEEVSVTTLLSDIDRFVGAQSTQSGKVMRL